MVIIFNGNADNTNLTSLKEYLVSKGYNFPCSGRGICGKCVVYCPSLEPTDRDRRFLDGEDLAQGMRLACDKAIVDGMRVDAVIERVPKFSDADACAILDKDRLEVYFVADGYVETRVEKVEATAVGLKSGVAHALLDMLEKHSVAKAGVIYVLGDRGLVSLMTGGIDIEQATTMDGVEMMLPTDEVYVVPFGGGDNSLSYVIDRAGLNKDDSVKKLVFDFRFRIKL